MFCQPKFIATKAKVYLSALLAILASGCFSNENATEQDLIELKADIIANIEETGNNLDTFQGMYCLSHSIATYLNGTLHKSLQDYRKGLNCIDDATIKTEFSQDLEQLKILANSSCPLNAQAVAVIDKDRENLRERHKIVTNLDCTDESTIAKMTKVSKEYQKAIACMQITTLKDALKTEISFGQRLGKICAKSATKSTSEN